MTKPGKVRCAVYTRKSSEEGLDQAFNSLHAQREAGEAYIKSQRHEGWTLIPTAYDDGGYSGGTLDRPALKALLTDIREGRVDTVVVYKIDRLTRSLFDFAKIVEILDAHKASFVSITQSFNTTTSMGRLTLNVLLSFAQFEREVTGERIRDKFAASKKKGMWMGGNVPLGYDLKDRKLILVEGEAQTIRTIFRLYAELGSVLKLKAALDRQNLRTKVRTHIEGVRRGGLPFRIGHLYTILRNPIYRGEVHHKGSTYAGDHAPIIDQVLWDKVQACLTSNAAIRRSGQTSKDPSLLAGILFDASNTRLTPTHTAKAGKRYRYYISNNLVTGTKCRKLTPTEGTRLSAQEVEGHVIKALTNFLSDPQKLMAAFTSAELDPATATNSIQQGKVLSQDLTGKDIKEIYEHVRDLVTRVQVDVSSITITIDRKALSEELGIPDHNDPEKCITITLPAELRRLGKEKRLIIAAHAPASNQDVNLIKAIVRANKWFAMLRDGDVASISDIARSEKLQRSYVSALVPFAFLAPDITQAILEGHQPLGLTLDRLLHLSPLPLEWSAQRSALGLN
ncbi:MAG: DNA-invertase hin [Nitrosomonadaceae bacterium]|nr:DNA-invertase hin [Nitrosomonadaceae bacterium]